MVLFFFFQIVKECNEGVRKMSRTEELINIEKTLEFKTKVKKKKKKAFLANEVSHFCGHKGHDCAPFNSHLIMVTP